MNDFLALKNPRTNRIVELKVGWSWTCFFFSSFMGIPLFSRKLYIQGFAMVMLDLFGLSANFVEFLRILDGSSSVAFAGWFISGIAFVLSIFFAIKGNEMYANVLRSQGWFDPNDSGSSTQATVQEHSPKNDSWRCKNCSTPNSGEEFICSECGAMKV